MLFPSVYFFRLTRDLAPEQADPMDGQAVRRLCSLFPNTAHSRIYATIESLGRLTKRRRIHHGCPDPARKLQVHFAPSTASSQDTVVLKNESTPPVIIPAKAGPGVEYLQEPLAMSQVSPARQTLPQPRLTWRRGRSNRPSWEGRGKEDRDRRVDRGPGQRAGDRAGGVKQGLGTDSAPTALTACAFLSLEAEAKQQRALEDIRLVACLALVVASGPFQL